MSLFTTFLFHFGVPLLFSYLMVRRLYRSKADWAVMFAFVGVYILFAFLAGRWYYFGTYWRFLGPIVFSLAAAVSLHKIWSLPWFGERGKSNWLLLMFIYMFTALLGMMALWSIYGLYLHVPPTLIAPPLKGSNYYVTEGGDSPLINQYHVLARAPYKYGVDFVQLGDWRTRANGMQPAERSAYFIFGDSVFAPVDAIVSETFDALSDSGIIDTSSTKVWGNFVKLSDDDTHFLLGYLQRNSIVVAVGDTVATGQFLGLVGASGGTPEPKLHIHAFRDHSESIWNAVGVPILINRRFPVRNRLFDFEW